jgi:hypothetical protein
MMITKHDYKILHLQFIGCSGFRACGPGFISKLEIDLGKPVVNFSSSIDVEHAETCWNSGQNSRIWSFVV